MFTMINVIALPKYALILKLICSVFIYILHNISTFCGKGVVAGRLSFI